MFLHAGDLAFGAYCSGRYRQKEERKSTFGDFDGQFPEARSAGLWLRHGWHVVVAYVAGFLVLMGVLGWQPHVPHKAESIPPRAESATQTGAR